MKKNIFLILLIWGCQKELNISEFSNDYLDYEPELRIEAVILPSDSSAIVRIDRSFLLTDKELYDCRDNDFGTISLDECNAVGGIWHGEESVDLIADCGDWNPFLHDVGSDGDLSIVDTDGSDGNGSPDCGEPNVDNYVEILPEIHLNGCEVKIGKIKNGVENYCEMEFVNDAGSFFHEGYYGDKSAPLLNNIELISYGGYVPKDCQEDFFIDYEAEYNFNADCRQIGFGNIVSNEPIILSNPPVFVIENDSDNIFNCIMQECLLDNSSIYNGLEFDTLYVPRGSINSILNYVTFAPNVYFQAVQFMYDKEEDIYRYYHGHPDVGYSINEDSGTIINTVNWMQETIVTEFYDGFGNGVYDEGEIFMDQDTNGEYSDNEYFIDQGDKKGDVNIYSYKIFTFSESYKRYYFFDKLPINDPVRSNLRDGDDLPIMGAFGSMSYSEIIFRIIDCGEFKNSQDCEDPLLSKSVCEWHENPPLFDYGLQEGEPYCLPINWFD